MDRFKRILKDNAIKSIKVLIEQAMNNPEYKLTSKQKVFMNQYYFLLLYLKR